VDPENVTKKSRKLNRIHKQVKQKPARNSFAPADSLLTEAKVAETAIEAEAVIAEEGADVVAAAEVAEAKEIVSETVQVLEEEADAKPEVPEADAEEADEPYVVESVPKKKIPKAAKVLLIIGGVLLTLVLIAVIAAVIIYNVMFNRSNYRAAEDTTVVEAAVETLETADEDIAAQLASEQAAAKASIQASMQEELDAKKQELADKQSSKEADRITREGVRNVLLIGTDQSDWGIGNSDAIIVCSINYDTETIYLTSIMRDTAANVPGRGVTKINSACAISGPELLVQTVEENFMIDIENYAMVDFEAMKQVIDALGGVDMMITVEEAKFMKIDIEEDQVMHLDGRLALRHSRDRSSGGSDFGRVQRQKEVLLAIIDKARSGGVGNLAQAAYACLPYITHDFSRTDLLEIISELPVLINYEFVQQRIPYEDMYHFEGEYIVLDYAATIKNFNDIVYGTEDGE